MDFDFNNLRQFAEKISLILLLGFMIYERVKGRLFNSKYNHLTLFLKKNEQIQEKLTEVRVVLNADRVKLFQFHNGDHYIAGDSALKCSVTHISLKSGVSYPQHATQCYSDVTLSNISHYVTPLIKDGCLFKKTEDLLDDDWKKVKTLNGTKTILLKRVGSFPELSGFVVITWQDDIEKPNKHQIAAAERLLDSVSLILRSRK